MFLLVALTFFSANYSFSQVTIGANKMPESFSVLELTDIGKGLRLPRLTAFQRDSLTNSAGFTTNPLANGLTIYNTTSNCLEYWNSSKWTSLCKGQANISFSPTAPNEPAFPSAGEERGPFTPSDNPNCTTETPAYNFTVMMGQDYLHVLVLNESTGEFRVSMDENPAATPRSAILRITNNCTQEYKEFFFTQDGDDSDCGDTVTSIPDILSENGTSLCGSGAAYLYLQGRPSTGEFIWTLNGKEVGRGTEYIATQGGTYIVYGDKIGCTAPATPQSITVSVGTGTAPAPVPLLVGSNNGYVCDPDEVVKLYAETPASGDIYWYKDGIRQLSPTDSSIDAGIGVWFAVVEDGGCSSLKSNSITVQLDPNAGADDIESPIFTVNGVSSYSSVSLCSGGSLLLKVETPEGNVTYTWYAGDAQNGLKLGTGTKLATTVAAVKNYLILQCVATKANFCTKSEYASFTISENNPPARPIITSNTGTVRCGNNTQLTATSSADATSFKWYRDGELLFTTTGNTLPVAAQGAYTVYALNNEGCVSEVSATHTINSSSGFALNLAISGNDSPNTNTSETYTATMTNNINGSFIWSVISGDAVIESQSDNTVSVHFGPAEGLVELSVTAANACGEADRPALLTLYSSTSCIPPTVTNYTPSSKAITVPEGANPNISITANTYGQTATYQWYRNDTKSTTGATAVGINSPLLSGETALVAGETYYYYCVVTALCGSNPSVTSDYFTVSAAINPNTVTALGSGSLSGKTCFDIAVSNDNANSCGSLTARASTKADFATMGVQNYTFKAAASGTVQNVRYVIQDDEGCVDGTKTPLSGILQAGVLNGSNSVTIPVYYKTTLNSSASTPLIVGRTKASAAKVTINIIYDDGSKDVKLALTAAIQDCMCFEAGTEL
ncbi:hypothetical protein AGMMS50239_14560 [Bacteroidia bacterium]|nr:hypothetical protein AGMMS50239_14560 [Bacteroidia bacterium]